MALAYTYSRQQVDVELSFKLSCGYGVERNYSRYFVLA
jgi:hypothetical protein